MITENNGVGRNTHSQAQSACLQFKHDGNDLSSETSLALVSSTPTDSPQLQVPTVSLLHEFVSCFQIRSDWT